LAAPLVWRAFGNVPNFVEPFAGSLAVLLARPGGAGKVETANDKDGLISNFWRATRDKPDEVARWADWPVNEVDLHARHTWLVKQAPALFDKLVADPEYSDPKIAGWWVWGISAWIGNGWCSRDEVLHRCLPQVGAPSRGIHAPSKKKPITGSAGKGVHRMERPPLAEVFSELRERLRDVRVVCGDWLRVLGRSTLGIDSAHGMSPCGVLLDPPYAHDTREKRIYREDDAHLSADVRAWAIENGDNPALRIALCGFDGEHAMPNHWQCVAWASTSSAKSRARERIWFSPHCNDVTRQRELFEVAS
jgi:DNA adenine methylase